jgi:hypothetical protein
MKLNDERRGYEKDEKLYYEKGEKHYHFYSRIVQKTEETDFIMLIRI